MMDSRLDWSALDTVCGVYGIEDPDVLIHQLMALRDHMRQQSG